MRAPNDMEVDLSDQRWYGSESRLIVVGSVLKSCESLLEKAAREGGMLCFEFTAGDLDFLCRFYSTMPHDEPGYVRELLGGVLQGRLRLPYDTPAVFRVAGTNRYYCRVVHELLYYD